MIYKQNYTYLDAASINWKIIGGKNASEGQFPHHVSLQIGGSHNCGGSLINKRYVLTAAHCVLGAEASDVSVLVGTSNLASGGQRYQAARLVAHENYTAFQFSWDIGLVKLSSDVVFGPLVQPIQVYNTEIT